MFKKPPPSNPLKDELSRHVRDADIHAKNGRYQDALASIDKALALDPKNYFARSFKERILQEMAKQGKEWQSKEDGLERRLEGVARLLRSAEQYMHVKQYKMALQEVAKVYAIDPNNSFAQSYSDQIEKLMREQSSPQKPAPPPPAPTPEVPQRALREQQVPESHEGRLELYRQLLKEMWFDGILNPQEVQELQKVRSRFRITDEEHGRLEKDVNMESYIEALRIAWRDGVITNNEDQVLQIMRRKYNISMEEHLSAEAKVLWARSTPHSKGTILIVDDEKTILVGLSLHLKKHGYDVVTAQSVEQAMELAQQSPPALILSDIFFEGSTKSGLDFYEDVRGHPNLKNTPFILMSGLIDEFLVRAALRMGIDSFLGKPFNLELLLATVEGKLQS